MLLFTVLSCKEQAEVKDTVNVTNSVSADTVQMKIVNEKDPICDMDVKEHLSDTALINGEVWGFCSPVCKEKYVSLKK